MKRLFLRTAALIVILLCVATKISHADNSFKVSLQNGLSVKSGETLEIPVILDNIYTDDVTQKGLITFSCNISYDENYFEFVSFDDNNFKADAIIDGSTKKVDFAEITYESTTKKLNFTMQAKYLKYVKDSINEYTKIGTFTFRAKDNLKTGTYYISTCNVTGQNDQVELNGNGQATEIKVLGLNDDEETPDYGEDLPIDNFMEEIINEDKPVKISIKQNKDGSKVYFIPNEEEGIEIGKIIVNNKEVARVDNQYILDSKPWETYTVYFYGKNGKFLCNRTITVTGNEETTINTTDETKEDENKDNEPKKEEPNIEESKDKKSPQTGDYVWIAVITLVIITAIWGTIIVKKRK